MTSVTILCVLGLLFSVYTVYEHYTLKEGEKAVCDFNSFFSCSSVLTSKYAFLMNVPLAVLGVSWFGVLLILCWNFYENDSNVNYLFGVCLWSTLGALFVIYFIVLEVIIGAVCPVCTVIHIITLAIFFISWRIFLNRSPNWNYFNLELSLQMLLKIKWVIFLAVLINIIIIIAFNLPLLLSSPSTPHSSPSPSSPSYLFNGEWKKELAKCVTRKGWVMYGSHKCTHCNHQKDAFGKEAFSFILFSDCAGEELGGSYPSCSKAGLKGYPSWVLLNTTDSGEKLVAKIELGYKDLYSLAKSTGCEN